jgi:hypothetical protein
MYYKFQKCQEKEGKLIDGKYLQFELHEKIVLHFLQYRLLWEVQHVIRKLFL